MRLHAAKPLFAWSESEDSPSLSTIRSVLASLPDEALLQGLADARGDGRNDCPVDALWGVLLLSVPCRHVFLNDCLAELRRNPSLCRFLGIRSVAAIPKPSNPSRFLDPLGQPVHRKAMRAVFDDLVRQRGLAVPDLGENTAGDSTALAAKAKKDAEAVAEEAEEGLPQPSGGRKEHEDDDGKVTKACEWFGCKLHLLVDARHEAALAWDISDAKTGDNERIEARCG